MAHNPSQYDRNFLAVIVRAALNEVDNRPDLDHWRVYDADKLTESILAHMLAFALAREEVDSEVAA